MSKFKFVVVSKDNTFKMPSEEFAKHASLGQIDISYVDNNTKPLAEVYNDYLSMRKSYDYMVFMHADVSFDIPTVIKRIEECGQKYDVMGFCGTTTVNVSQSPLNWWTSSNPTPLCKWGCVTHGELGDNKSFFSAHSPDVKDHEVACIDGLCIIFGSKALDSDLKFDPRFDFDFYDTDISFQALMNYKLKLGVIIEDSLKHYSVGRGILSSAFLLKEIDFRNKWKLEIPANSPIHRLPKGEVMAHAMKTGQFPNFGLTPPVKA